MDPTVIGLLMGTLPVGPDSAVSAAWHPDVTLQPAALARSGSYCCPAASGWLAPVDKAQKQRCQRAGCTDSLCSHHVARPLVKSVWEEEWQGQDRQS